MLQPKTCKLSHGFTIIEALVAIAILAGVIITLLGVVPYAFHSVERNADNVQAVAAGQQYADALREAVVTKATVLPGPTTAPMDGGKSFEDGSIAGAAGTFSLSHNSCPNVPGSNARDCIVTVTWNERGATQNLSLESYVTAPQ